MAESKDRCWPGYEPVKGKKQHEQGSCRPKAASKMTTGEKKFRGKRKEQLTEWKKDHPASTKQAAQHLRKPAAATKKRAVKKSTRTSKKSAARK